MPHLRLSGCLALRRIPPPLLLEPPNSRARTTPVMFFDSDRAIPPPNSSFFSYPPNSDRALWRLRLLRTLQAHPVVLGDPCRRLRAGEVSDSAHPILPCCSILPNRNCFAFCQIGSAPACVEWIRYNAKLRKTETTHVPIRWLFVVCCGRPCFRGTHVQCGGSSWAGSTCCSDGLECVDVSGAGCYSQVREAKHNVGKEETNA